MKSKKTTWLIVIVVVLLLVAFILWPKKPQLGAAKDPLADGTIGTGGSTGNSNAGSTTGGTSTPTPVSSIFPLKMGSRGEEVRNIQRAFNFNNRYWKNNYPVLAEDGIYGKNTDAMVGRIFTADKGFVSKGRYDWIMKKFLNKEPLQSATNKPVNSSSIISASNISRGANALAKIPLHLLGLNNYNGEDVRPVYMEDNFPLKLGSYGDKVLNINTALGLSTSGMTDPREFTKVTESQLFGKFKRTQVDKGLYAHIMEINRQNPALLHNLVKGSKWFDNVKASPFGFPVDLKIWN
jgi:peptidoglycan hydrolase-like protein with peptidoglycan-binding domain